MVTKNLEELKEDINKVSNIVPDMNIPMDKVPFDKVDSRGNVQIGGGSGFIVDKKGIVLTNRHVIYDADVDYSVISSNGKKFEAKVLARDPLEDIALLKIDPGDTKLTTVKLGDSDQVKPGKYVLAFGNVLGLFKDTVSLGIVSGLSRSVTANIAGKSNPYEMRGLIQTDAAINPGNSGGPLTDIDGNVIGINTAIVAGAQNIGFAIPIKVVARDLKELEKYDSIKRPFLGVRYITLDRDSGEKLNQPSDYGALVIKSHAFDEAVVKGSPADKAGIREGDIILEWNSKKITTDKNIQDYLSEADIGNMVALKILRGREVINTKVTLKERK